MPDYRIRPVKIMNGTLISILAVGSGGFIGAVSRFLIGFYLSDFKLRGDAVYGTLTVNVVGSLLAGLLMGGISSLRPGSNVQLFLIPGFLGGFTTFSALSLETVNFMRRGETVAALANISANMVLGILAVFLGFILSKQFS